MSIAEVAVPKVIRRRNYGATPSLDGWREVAVPATVKSSTPFYDELERRLRQLPDGIGLEVPCPEGATEHQFAVRVQSAFIKSRRSLGTRSTGRGTVIFFEKRDQK